MQVAGCTALVTGANRGIGRGFVEALLARGARRVYATARRAESLDPVAALDASRVIPLALDVTDEAAVVRTAATATDVDLLVNNAGIAARSRLIGAPDLAGARAEMETNFWGQLATCRAFAPVLRANGGGAIVQVLSVGAVACFPQVGTYCASKFAARAMVHGVRLELQAQGTVVAAVYSGAVESDMSRDTPGAKAGSRPSRSIDTYSGDENESRGTRSSCHAWIVRTPCRRAASACAGVWLRIPTCTRRSTRPSSRIRAIGQACE